MSDEPEVLPLPGEQLDWIRSTCFHDEEWWVDRRVAAGPPERLETERSYGHARAMVALYETTNDVLMDGYEHRGEDPVLAAGLMRLGYRMLDALLAYYEHEHRPEYPGRLRLPE